MAKSHAERRISPLLGRKPEIREFRRFGIVRADNDRLHALVSSLGVKVRVRGACLGNVRSPKDKEARIVPIGAFGDICLFAPCLGTCWRQVAIPVIERSGDTADELQVARAGSIGDHRHGRDRREAEYAVRSPFPDGMSVRSRDDFVGFLPTGANKTAEAAAGNIVSPLVRIFLDRLPGSNGRHRLSCRPPGLQQPGTDQGVFHPVCGIEIPAIACTTRTAARLMIGQVVPGAGIVCLLGFPGDDASLHIDLPGTGSGAVHTVRGAHDLVVAPAVPVGLLPGSVLVIDDAVSGREGFCLAAKEGQAIKCVAHRGLPFIQLVQG